MATEHPLTPLTTKATEAVNELAERVRNQYDTIERWRKDYNALIGQTARLRYDLLKADQTIDALRRDQKASSGISETLRRQLVEMGNLNRALQRELNNRHPQTVNGFALRPSPNAPASGVQIVKEGRVVVTVNPAEDL